MGAVVNLAEARAARAPVSCSWDPVAIDPVGYPVIRQPVAPRPVEPEPAPKAKPARRPEWQESFKIDFNALAWVAGNLGANDAAAFIVLSRGVGQRGQPVTTWGASAISRNSGMTRAAGVIAMNRLRKAGVIADADPVGGWDAVRIVSLSRGPDLIEVSTAIWDDLDTARSTRDPIAVLIACLAHRVEPEVVPQFPAAMA